MKRALVAAIAATLAGCTPPPVQLSYPDGRVVECPMPGSVHPAIGANMQGQCIHDHMAQGAVRL